MSGTIALICNDCEKLYKGACWRTKPKLCYHCRQPRHFIIDCPIKKNNKGFGMMNQSNARKNIPQNH